MKGIFNGPLAISSDGAVSGIVKGDVTIRNGARAAISGIVKGDVIVEAGSEAIIWGMVSGIVYGNAVISGMVNGHHPAPPSS